MYHEFVPSRGLTMEGKHHEIYLSDARKVEPARLRTILRQPVVAGCGLTAGNLGHLIPPGLLA